LLFQQPNKTSSSSTSAGGVVQQPSHDGDPAKWARIFNQANTRNLISALDGLNVQPLVEYRVARHLLWAI